MAETTEERFRKALMALMGRFPYDSISVQGICDEAGLSRKTFSRHFTSKEDVVAAQLRADIAAPTATVLSVLPVNSFADSAWVLFRHSYSNFYANRDFYQSAIHVLGFPWFTERVIETGKWIGEAPYSQNDVRNPAEMDFVITLFGGVSAAALRWWVENDFSLTPDELVDWVIRWGYSQPPTKGIES